MLHENRAADFHKGITAIGNMLQPSLTHMLHDMYHFLPSPVGCQVGNSAKPQIHMRKMQDPNVIRQFFGNTLRIDQQMNFAVGEMLGKGLHKQIVA